MTLNIGLVAEGPTDGILIEGILDHILERSFVLNILQPIGNADIGFGLRGAGWKGVKRWCEEIANNPGFHSFLFGSVPYDLFILQVDLDVAREEEIKCFDSHQSIEQNAILLKQMICQWLNIPSEQCPFIMLVPADNLEAWILAYLTNDLKYHPIEDVKKPDKIISRRPFAVKKSGRNYKLNIVPNLIANWSSVKQKCIQAKKFEEDVLNCLQ